MRQQKQCQGQLSSLATLASLDAVTVHRKRSILLLSVMRGTPAALDREVRGKKPGLCLQCEISPCSMCSVRVKSGCTLGISEAVLVSLAHLLVRARLLYDSSSLLDLSCPVTVSPVQPRPS